jgi:predicted dehydrogenase
MAKVKIGVVGCGYWGPKLLRNFYEMPNVDVVFACDLRKDRLDHVKKLYPLTKLTQDYRQLIRANVDAVVVATPPATHYQIAKEALLQDKHTLIEKPLTLNSRDAEELIELAEKKGKVLMVGHTYEYNPAVEALKEIISTGQIGDVYYMSATRVNLGIFQKDLNVVWDLAPHDIAIFLYLLGMEPIAVSARGAAYVQPGIHDVAYLTTEFPNNILGDIRVSWLDPCKTRRITIVGSKKMIVYDDVENLEKIKIYDKGVEVPPYTDTFGDFQLSYRYGDISIPQIQMAEPLKLECLHFIDCVLGKGRPRSDGRVGLKVVKVLECAQRSLLNGGRSEKIPWQTL